MGTFVKLFLKKYLTSFSLPFRATILVQCEMYSARHTSFPILSRIVDVLIYCLTELVELVKVKKWCQTLYYILQEYETVHCQPMHSGHHILVTENRLKKKFSCRVWFHWRIFHQLWGRLTEGMLFDSLVEKAGTVDMDTTPSKHFSTD